MNRHFNFIITISVAFFTKSCLFFYSIPYCIRYSILPICNTLDISTDYFLDEKVAKKELNIIPTNGYDIFLSIAVLIKIGFITYDNKKKRYNLNFDDMSLKEFIDEMLSINKLQYLNNIDELMHNIVVAYGKNYDNENKD